MLLLLHKKNNLIRIEHCGESTNFDSSKLCMKMQKSLTFRFAQLEYLVLSVLSHINRKLLFFEIWRHQQQQKKN